MDVISRVCPIVNGPGGADRIFLTAVGDGKVQVDYAAGQNPAGPVHKLDRAQYEAMQEQLARDGQATLPSYDELYPPPEQSDEDGGSNPGSTTTPNGNTQGRVVGETPAQGRSAKSSNPPVEAETDAEAKASENILDGLQTALDVASLAPGLNIPAGAANAAISLLRGDFFGAGLFAVSMIPFAGWVGTAAKTGRSAAKIGGAAEKTGIKAGKETAGKTAKDKAGKEVAKDQAEKDAAKNAKSKDGAKGKKDTSKEKGNCGEWLSKLDLADQGFDDIVSVQNNSGHGVDLIGRNSKTGEVKVWEVKTTDGPQAGNLSRPQKELGGKRFTEDRLSRAARGQGNYGKLPNVQANARKARQWLDRAGKNVTHEKREVFIDDIEKGCMKHPTRKTVSKPW